MSSRDEISILRNANSIHTETSFTHVTEKVEKSEIDLYNSILDHNNVSLDLYFVGPL